MKHTTTIIPVSASSPGTIPGFQIDCTCGLSWKVSLPEMAQQEAAEHLDWHARMSAAASAMGKAKAGRPASAATIAHLAKARAAKAEKKANQKGE